MDLERQSPPTPRIGQRASRSRLVSRHDIELFAELTGDRSHRESHEFGAEIDGRAITVASGVTSAVLHALVTEELPGPGTVFLQLNLRFHAAVRPADVITGTVEVTASWPDDAVTELNLLVTRDDGAVAVEGTAVCHTGVTPESSLPGRV